MDQIWDHLDAVRVESIQDEPQVLGLGDQGDREEVQISDRRADRQFGC